ncbi:peptide chain release factor N(5)-glutamine methyltransferase [Candidatus Pelagibacter sp.]|nr:peptide chain release factor N(5)-glutamine methyltransferase [Candidatus Pelagibacter sp.]|tara:strand:- start:1955 stop:2797 length:843 start_codon:yes stop_codon:yes gene_type:complete
MRIQTAIEDGERILKKNNIKTFRIDAEILMSTSIKKDRKYIFLNLNNKLCEESIKIFKKNIQKRSTGKPIAYIVGEKDFWKYSFKVREGVLIPRPDTELLIEEVLKLTKNKSNLNLLEIGIGSGCVLLSILKEKKNFYGTGVDLSKKCVELSKINAFNLGLRNRVKIFESDIDNFNHGKYDLIISNPPYINKIKLKYLEKDVKNFEPILALNGGLDGMSVIRKVINKSSELIKKNGILVLEIAFNQKNKVVKLLEQKGFYINKVLKDLANNDRCIICTKR